MKIYSNLFIVTSDCCDDLVVFAQLYFALLQTDGAEEGSDGASGESDRKEESHRAAVRDGNHRADRRSLHCGTSRTTSQNTPRAQCR